MLDAQRLHHVELEAMDLIRARGYDVVPFGLGEWNDAPALAAAIAGTFGPLRNAPDAIAETVTVPSFVEIVNAHGEQGDRSLTLAKLVALWPWSNIAPCLVLDMSDRHVWPFADYWPYLVTGAGGPRQQPARKAYAWLSRSHDHTFDTYWPERQPS